MFTERNGSTPYTSIFMRFATLATRTPMAPRPITPIFLPISSVPANCCFAFSISLLMFSLSAFSFAQLIPPTTSRAARSIPVTKSSLTPFAFAPGVLKTTIPLSAHLSRGILFTPAPALATAQRLSESSISCIAALLTKTASASAKSSVFVYSSVRLFKPISAIGLRHVYLNIMHSPPQTSS